MRRFVLGAEILAKLVQAVMNSTDNKMEQNFNKAIADFVSGAANANSGEFRIRYYLYFIFNKMNPKEMVIEFDEDTLVNTRY